MKKLKHKYKIIKNVIVNSNVAKKVFENSSWLLTNSIFNMILGVFVTAIVARYFGPNKFGQLNYAVAFVSLFAAIANLGLDTLTIKNIVDETWDEGIILCTSFILRVIGGFLLTIVSYIVIKIIEPNDTNIHILVLIMSFTMMLKAFEVIEYWIQAYQKSKISSIIRMITYILVSLLRILVVVFKGSITVYTFIYLIDSAVFGVASLIVYFKIREKTLPWKFNITYARYILSQSWYLILSGLMVSLYNRIDQVMLGSMLISKSETGVYSAAVTLAEMWYFVPMAIITSFKPVIMSKKNENQESYNKSVQTLYNIITFISITFGILVTIFSRLIVSILYGAAFTKSANILIILVWAGTFAMLGCCRSIWLVSEGLQKYSMFYTFVGCMVNIPLNYLLIPMYGAYGAAIATLLAQISNIIALSFFEDTKISSVMIMKSFSPVYMFKSLKKIIHEE